MKRARLFLLMGIALSVLSKVLQFQFGSIWGDLIILPAAVFFVLAILLYLPQYQAFLQNEKTRKRAKLLAFTCCLAVLSFQLFTMLAFGRSQSWGWLLLLPFLLLVGFSIATWLSMQKNFHD